MTDRDTVGFVPPPYPYDRLDAYQKLAAAHDGGIVDLSIGTPCDPPPLAVIEALSQSNSERGYPASIGSEALRRSIARWMGRRFEIDVRHERVRSDNASIHEITAPRARHSAVSGCCVPHL